MYKKLSFGVVVALLAMFVVPVFVNAQEDSTPPSQPVETTVNSESTENEATKSEKRQARIAEIKEKIATKLTQFEEKKIANVCKVAQTKVSTIQTKLNTVVENRRTKYSDLTTKIKELSLKLDAAGVDTTELNSAISTIETEIETVITSIDEYITMLSDLSEMDCAADPTGFKATLEALRTKRVEIVSMQGVLKSSINESVKPILQNIRPTLQEEKTTIVEEETGE